MIACKREFLKAHKQFVGLIDQIRRAGGVFEMAVRKYHWFLETFLVTSRFFGNRSADVPQVFIGRVPIITC